MSVVRVCVVAARGALLGSFPRPRPPPASLEMDLEPDHGRSVDHPFLGENVLRAVGPIATRAAVRTGSARSTSATAQRRVLAGPGLRPFAPCAATPIYTTPGSYAIVMTVTDTEATTVSEHREVEAIAASRSGDGRRGGGLGR